MECASTDEFLTENHAAQRSAWAAGAEANVNPGEKGRTRPDGRLVTAMGSVLK